MMITTLYLSSLLKRDIIDPDEILDGIKNCITEDIEIIRNTRKKTVIKFTISEGKSVYNTLLKGTKLQIIIYYDEVYEIEDYRDPSVLVVTATDRAVRIEFCDVEGIEVRGVIKPYQRTEDIMRCHFDLRHADQYSLRYEVPDKLYSLEFNSENILKAINQLSVEKYEQIAFIRK